MIKKTLTTVFAACTLAASLTALAQIPSTGSPAGETLGKDALKHPQLSPEERNSSMTDATVGGKVKADTDTVDNKQMKKQKKHRKHSESMKSDDMSGTTAAPAPSN